MIENQPLDGPLVTAVVPVFNGSDYLGEALESLINQTYQNLEIVVVNDGSTDDGATAFVANKYKDKIRYFEKSNGGVASALNYAISKAKGEYITWLSHDDIFAADKIQVSLDVILKHSPQSVVVYTDFSVFTINKQQQIPIRLQAPHPRQFRFWLTENNQLHGCTVMASKKIFEEIGLFDENLKTTQDYDMWFRIAKRYDFIHIPKITVLARSHENQGSVSMAPLVLKECEELLSKFVLQLTEEEISASGNVDKSTGYMKLRESMRLRGFHKTAKLIEDEFIKNSTYCKMIEVKIYRITWLMKKNLSKIKNVISRLSLLRSKMTQKESISVEEVSKLPLKDKFSIVYSKNIFGGRKSRSGEGSDLDQTAIIRNEIPLLLKSYKIDSMIDAPCGDWFWMQKVTLPVQRYFGIDIVSDLIEKNTLNYSSEKITFQCLDLTKDELPKVDLIFSRDMLVHLSFEDAFAVLSNFKSSGAKYLLTTTFTNRQKNEDLGDGFWRPLNKQLSPFNFPEPVEVINERCTEGDNKFTDKSLGLWKLDDINIPKY